MKGWKLPILINITKLQNLITNLLAYLLKDALFLYMLKLPPHKISEESLKYQNIKNFSSPWHISNGTKISQFRVWDQKLLQKYHNILFFSLVFVYLSLPFSYLGYILGLVIPYWCQVTYCAIRCSMGFYSTINLYSYLNFLRVGHIWISPMVVFITSTSYFFPCFVSMMRESLWPSFDNSIPIEGILLVMDI